MAKKKPDTREATLGSVAGSSAKAAGQYGREVFERLRRTLEIEWRGDTLVAATDNLIAPNYEVRDKGIFLLENTGDEWTPVCELEGPDAPDPLSAPALPFPFSGRELAAFFLDGWGHFLGDRFAMLDGGPDDETMQVLLSGARDTKPRAALIAASEALAVARQHVPEIAPEEARIEAQYRQAIAGEPIAGRLDHTAEALKVAQAARQSAQRTWCRAMVRCLLGAGAFSEDERFGGAFEEAAGKTPAIEGHKTAILECLIEQGYVPTKLTGDGNRLGSPVKQRIKALLVRDRPQKLSTSQFDRAWQALRDSREIGEG